MSTRDEEFPLSAEDSVALIEREGRQASREFSVDPAPIFGLWGVAWLVGFGAIFLASEKGPGPFLPMWAAGVLLGVLYAAALVVPIALAVRAGRGVSGPSNKVGAMYGWSWFLAFLALAGINQGLVHQGVAGDAVVLLWSSTVLLVVGLLHLAGGMLWQDTAQYALGLWVLLTGAGSVLAGVPGNFLLLALAGGGGFLLQCVYYLARRGGIHS